MVFPAKYGFLTELFLKPARHLRIGDMSCVFYGGRELSLHVYVVIIHVCPHFVFNLADINVLGVFIHNWV